VPFIVFSSGLRPPACILQDFPGHRPQNLSRSTSAPQMCEPGLLESLSSPELGEALPSRDPVCPGFGVTILDSKTEKQVCTMCGDEKSASGLWFLLAENRWEDKLKILQWDSQLARQDGIRRACSAAHVQELVVHWMTTGSLNYPFARVSSDDRAAPRCDGAWPLRVDVDTHVARQI